MKEDKLARLIRRLENFAAKNPGLYKQRVALLAALGYVYLLVLVVILMAVVVVMLFYVRINYLVLKVVWIPIVLVGIVLRSLWITIPVPDGTELQREQAPALFDLIHEVTTKLNGPKVHHVLVSSDFNAGIVQIPQFGMFGWLNNYLVVGLPLLRAISAAEFRAVLAHEVGHLSGKHGRFSGWIYRLRQSWIEVLTRVHQERHYASFLFEPFVNWYAPYLNAYSFVLARAQERHADQYSVELAGKEVAATSLARMEVKGRELSNGFWPKFFSQSKEEAKAPRDPFEQMLNGLGQPIGAVKAQKWFFEALREPTGYDDTHPALGDRLAAIGYPKDSPQVTALLAKVLKADDHNDSAASYYLREVPEDFLARQNRLLREMIVQPWNETHAQSNERKRQLSKLEEQANARPLTPEEQWQRVTLVSQVRGQDASIPLLQAILRDDPDHSSAHFALGAMLLGQQNAEGVVHLEKAMQLKPALVGEASTLLAGFYLEQGDTELADRFRVRADEHEKKEQERREKAVDFSQGAFIPHDLSEEALNALKAELNKARGLSEAFLFRKVIDESDSVYVLAFLAGFTWLEGRSDKHLGPLMEDLTKATTLPEPIILLSLDLNNNLVAKVRAVPGATIYKRG